ncbi:alpha/beta hydrolase-fold protein [Planomicrobium sp. CPCC 101079]|uniref:alpha/beta hydrolase-fold protein n=1 Tax=Planomicrobium sp. CPCC 101079 TaxID=2599618 RepID=UPI001645767A|nr:alpha/beta hydrolase-fold protein [Planomicrobium sp. CPCC 101079]
MKKVISLGIMTVLVCSLFGNNQSVSAAGASEVDYTDYAPGVTVEADPASPTGYYATFVYEDETSAATKVELYSDTFHHFTIKDGFENPYKPENYKTGMFPAGGNSDTTYYLELKKIGEDLWGGRVPLSSGAYPYNFRITNPDGSTTARLDDPNNPTLTNTATGIQSVSSMVYIPYDRKIMGKGDWLDRSVELPRTDHKTGTVETVAYTGAAGDTRGLAVYLPDGYNPNRKKPYKVLYMSHGMSGDRYGNELRWMNEGAVANITDNLIADGKAEPFIVVTMNNQDFNWDYKKIEEDQFEHIMPYVETNYNVYDTPEGRAYAGLSMGGMTTNRMYFNHADEFAYFGIWSYAVTGEELSNIGSYSHLDDPSVMIGVGIWDYLIEPVQNLHNALNEEGIEHAYLEVPAAHDWKSWHLLYAAFVEDHLWKSDNGKEEKKKEKEKLKEEKEQEKQEKKHAKKKE